MACKHFLQLFAGFKLKRGITLPLTKQVVAFEDFSYQGKNISFEVKTP